jgi:pyruvate kinase
MNDKRIRIPDWEQGQLEGLIQELTRIRSDTFELEARFFDGASQLHDAHLSSARNLLHHLALRRRDIRPLQEMLASLGLSSLGRAESHVLFSLDAVLKILHHLANRRWRMPEEFRPEPGFAEGKALLESHTEALLGPPTAVRDVRIMVTMPSEAASDYLLVWELLAHGMDCMRINCAHDDANAWIRMLDNLRRARQELGKDCHIFMDLTGPKLRTGPIESSPQIGLPNEGRVNELAAKAQSITLKKGDTLILTNGLLPGRPATYDDQGQLLSPARIGVTLPEVFSDIRPGEAVWLDDGKIGGVIRSVEKDQIQVEITQARPKGKKLRADKGINLPDSELRLDALTKKDIEDLPFIACHADIVGYSFVRNETDVYELQSRLIELGGQRLGIVLKIETRKAFEQLPNLLLAAMRWPCAGVMVARGDLAVECGYERMAEVQEEILWFSEAAHMPVIWATQVLDKLAKKGLPSRAEITDAAMGERAECVMLNKGPFIVEAAKALDDILRRMQSHQSKKSSILRQLKVADEFFLPIQKVEF